MKYLCSPVAREYDQIVNDCLQRNASRLFYCEKNTYGLVDYLRNSLPCTPYENNVKFMSLPGSFLFGRWPQVNPKSQLEQWH